MADITLVHDVCNERALDLSVYSTDHLDNELDEGFNTVNKGLNPNAQIGRGQGKQADEYRFLALYDLNNVILKSGVITAAAWWLYISASTLAQGVNYTWQIDRITRTDWHEGWSCWDNYKQNTPWTAPGGDYSSPSVAASIPTGADKWFSVDITTLAQDARANRGDILTMIFRRTDSLADAGIATVYTKQREDASGYGGQAPHVRITYTLDSRTFQALIR